MKKRDWTILLVGGSSGVGKSFLSRQLSKHYDIPVMEIDNIRITIMQFVNPEDEPDLFVFWHNPDHHNKFSIIFMVKKLEKIAEIVWKALDVLITKHIRYGESAIFEGDGILPKLLSKRDQKQIKAIFIYDSLEEIKKREEIRNRGGNSKENASKQAELSYVYGNQIKNDAEKYNYPAISAYPLKTLFKRVINEIDK